jgi:hypothetical protein
MTNFKAPMPNVAQSSNTKEVFGLKQISACLEQYFDTEEVDIIDNVITI